VRDGTIGVADLQPGVANKVAFALSVGGLGRNPTSSYSFSTDDAAPFALKKGQQVLVDGHASYYSQNAVLFFVGTCAYVAGAGATTTINSDFVSFRGSERFAVNGLYTAPADQVVTIGHAHRSQPLTERDRARTFLR
jgi:hypothetical protein